MFYLIAIVGATCLVALGNFAFDGVYTLGALGSSTLCATLGTVSVIAIDGIAAFVVRRMPEKWFAPEAPFFAVKDKECDFYRRLRINAWKNYVPELGCFTGFHKDKLQDPYNSVYLGRFLLESNYGFLGHAVGAVLGFLILLLPYSSRLSVGLPIALVNFVLSMLPAMILRFNTPALRRLYRRSLRKEARTQEPSNAND